MVTSKGYVIRLRLVPPTALTIVQPNILVDGSGHARIVDFGFAKIARNLDSIPSASVNHGYTPRWSAPEVLTGGSHSKEADVFSFAMVAIEVFPQMMRIQRFSLLLFAPMQGIH